MPQFEVSATMSGRWGVYEADHVTPCATFQSKSRAEADAYAKLLNAGRTLAERGGDDA